MSTTADNLAASAFPPRLPPLGRTPFALPMAGAKLRHTTFESGHFQFENTSPFGRKPIVALEVRGQSGILTKIQTTQSTATTHTPIERNGRIRIFTDDPDIPIVNMSLNDFFCYAENCDVFDGQMVGSKRATYTNGTSYQRSAFRSVWIPFDQYCRVEFSCADTAETPLLYCNLDWWETPAPYRGPLQQYRIFGTEQFSLTFPAQITVCDVTGAGQLESFWVSALETGSNITWREGNWEIYVDGEPFPEWLTNGTEDTFDGGYYQVDVGGYPAGAAGLPRLTPGGAGSTTWYRFFPHDALAFTTSLKIIYTAGQIAESTLTTPTADISAFAGLWLSTPPVVQPYTTKGALIYSAPTNNTVGSDLPAPWVLSGSTHWQGAAGAVASFGANNVVDAAALIPRTTIGTDDYRVEARINLGGPPAVGSGVFVSVRASTSNPVYQWSAHAFIGKVTATQTNATVQEGNPVVAQQTNISTASKHWNDTGLDIDVAVECEGNVLRGYVKYAEQLHWRSIGTFELSTTGGNLARTTGGVGFRSTNQLATIKSFNVYALTKGGGASTSSVPTPALAQWLRADRGVGLDYGQGQPYAVPLVNSWRDHASRELHVTQGTPTNEPSYIAVAQNGLPCVRFGAAATSKLAGYPLPNIRFVTPGHTLFVVCKPSAPTVGNGALISNIAAGGQYGFWALVPTASTILQYRTQNGQGAVTSVAINTAGAYTVAPTGVTFTGGNGSGATGTVQTSGTSPNIIVTGVTVTAGGSNYTSAPTVAFTGGTGTAATATASVSVSAVNVNAVMPGGIFPALPVLVELHYDGANMAVWWNGTQLATAAQTGYLLNPAAPLLVGYSGSNYFEGDIYEIVAYDQAQSTANRAAVRAYLNAKYALY